MKPKKQLGQNFLTSSQVVEDIVRAGDIGSNDIVLEIGPGKGFLTQKLLEKAKKVIAIEKDRELIPFLQEKFAFFIENGQLELVEADILLYDPALHSLKAQGYKLIANIPYYITGEILQKFLETPLHPSLMVLMVQKEVAARIIATNKKESLLSLSVKAYGTPSIVRKVGKGSFYPSPSVDSAVIKIATISKNFFGKVGEKAFFTTLKTGFSHKRKFLINNLTPLAEKVVLETLFADLELPLTIRAEDVSLENWKQLTSHLS